MPKRLDQARSTDFNEAKRIQDMVIRCDSARNMGTVSFFEKYVYNQLDE
jgi:hypothetical protein